MKSQNFRLLSQILLCAALAICEFGCGDNSAPSIPVNVSVDPPSTALQGVGVQSFTATVSNDPKNAGVTWTVSCPSAPCGSVSPTQTPSGQPITYTSPPTALANNMNVTLTATSVTSAAASATATVTLSAVQLNIIADNYAVEPGAQSHLTVTIWNGINPININWSCSPSPCGTTLPATTQSGAPTTYTAPSTVPAAGLTANVTAVWADHTSISSSQAIQIDGVQVSVTPSSANLLANASQQFRATVANDTTNSGVNWTVSCTPGPPCGAVSPPTTLSGIPTTYTAPSTPPPSDLSVAITAASAAYAAATSIASVTVPAVTVSTSPASGLIPLNMTQAFTATVGNDPNNAGVTWTLTQGTPPTTCSPGCGTVSPSTTLSGNPTTYTAPSAIPGSPADPAVTLAATSVTDTTKSSTVAIALSSGTVQLVPYNLDFGSVVVKATSQPRSVTLTNTGASVLSITGVSITGTNAGDFSVSNNSCGSSVTAAASCTISVVFTPSTTGQLTAKLSITDSSTDSPQLISLSGSGQTRRVGEGERARAALSSAGTVAVPLPTGTDPVGTRILDLIDSSREDPFLGGANRELLVRLWYPASLTKDCKPADYASPRVWRYFSQLLGVPLPQVITNSCVNAPVADGLHPVVVFTHGYTGTFTDYTFIAEDLASRGYVIASVDHTYEATAVEFPDGRFVKSVLGSHLVNTWRGDDATLRFAGSVRLQDLKFVLNELGRLNSRVDDPFGGRLDLSRLAIAGHSVGGAIAFQALEGDARFKAAVILDGSLPIALVHPTHAPVLVVSARRSLATPDQCTLWTNLHGHRLYVNLNGAEHLTLSDALWLAKGAIKTGPMGPDRTVAAIRDYIAAFLDTNLRDRTVHPLLTGPSAIYPDASVTTEDQLECSQRAPESATQY